jgi:hypothetical protein
MATDPGGVGMRIGADRWSAFTSGDKRAGAHAVTRTAIDLLLLAGMGLGAPAAEATDASLAASSATEGADFIQALGLVGRLRPGAASGFAKSGSVAGGVSKVPLAQLHPSVADLVASAPENLVGFGGGCAEMSCISAVLDRGENPVGGTIRTVAIRRPGDPLHGAAKQPCELCAWILDQLGVLH